MTIPGRIPPDSMPDTVLVRVHARTDVGRSREHNEDAYLVADLTTGLSTLTSELATHAVGGRGTVLMVADGLGGAAAGEVASRLAVDTVLDTLRAHTAGVSVMEAERFARGLRLAAEQANARIHAYAHDNPEHRGLGTTATIAGILGDHVYVAQVGDSRAYLVRNGVARQITKDQSLTQRLVDVGELTPEEAERSERRNIILQALGPEPLVKIDLTHQQLNRGDTLILCTDGLSGLLSPERIAELVSMHSDLDALCDALVDEANARGGPDNITVVAARVDGPGLAPAGNGDAVGHHVLRLPGDEPGSAELLAQRRAERDREKRDGAAGGARRGARSGDATDAHRPDLMSCLLLALLVTSLLAATIVFVVRRVRGSGEAAHAPSAAAPAHTADSARAPAAAHGADTPTPPPRAQQP
ncbi:MAG TPA: protein phosphatase 2C domain-containing protein [Gemmatimonadaceae bacterium]|nr:protein phosphatase 2C domain-containing protein [Gemmatimonadaceae bacterium]